MSGAMDIQHPFTLLSVTVVGFSLGLIGGG